MPGEAETDVGMTAERTEAGGQGMGEGYCCGEEGEARGPARETHIQERVRKTRKGTRRRCGQGWRAQGLSSWQLEG